MKVKFRVQHEVISGLRYLQMVKRKGIKVDKSEEMMVCRPSAFTYRSSMNVVVDVLMGACSIGQLRTQYRRESVPRKDLQEPPYPRISPRFELR